MKAFKLIILSILVILFATSCETLIQTLGTVFKEPKVSIKSFQVGEFSLEKLNFNLNLELNNPNPIGIKTAGTQYNLDLNNVDLINGNINNGIDIKANDTSEITIPISINVQKLLPVVSSIFTNPNNVNYKVYGVVSFDTPIGKLPINWDKEDNLTIPKIF